MKVDVRVYVETVDNFEESDLRREIIARLSGLECSTVPAVNATRIIVTSRTGTSRWSRIVRKVKGHED